MTVPVTAPVVAFGVLSVTAAMTGAELAATADAVDVAGTSPSCRRAPANVTHCAAASSGAGGPEPESDDDADCKKTAPATRWGDVTATALGVATDEKPSAAPGVTVAVAVDWGDLSVPTAG